MFKLYISLLKGNINSFFIFKEEEGLYNNIKYIAIAVNAVLLSVKLNFYFYIFKLYRELFKKLIIIFIIIANTIPNFIKYLVVLGIKASGNCIRQVALI